MTSRVIFLALLAIAVDAYPDGAPQDACAALSPQHDNSRQTTAAPFVITTDADNYQPGSAVTVTIDSPNKENFKGFLVVARQVGGTDNEGEFAPIDDSAKTLDCSATADAITHSNNNDKGSIQFLWQPSSANFKGNIVFTATVVQTYEKYWTGVKSSAIEFN